MLRIKQITTLQYLKLLHDSRALMHFANIGIITSRCKMLLLNYMCSIALDISKQN